MAKTSGGVRKGKSSHVTSVPLAPVGAPPVHGIYNHTLMRHMKAIEDDPFFFNRTTERLYVFNQDGSLAFSESQHDPSSVRLEKNQFMRLGNKILIHNHPSGGEFSMGDIWVASTYNAAEIRATGRKGTYIIRRPPGGWPPQSVVEETLNNSRTLRGYFLSGDWSKRFAQTIGADWKFVPRQLY